MALNYVNRHHDFVPVGSEAKATDPSVTPEEPEKFQRTYILIFLLCCSFETNYPESLVELSKDLMVKARQIELLIDSLPGIGVNEKEQMAKVRELENKLQDVERERIQALKEKEQLLRQCDNLILAVTRSKVDIDRNRT